MNRTFDIRQIADQLRGEVVGPYQVRAPGPGCAETDRSLVVMFDVCTEDEPFVFSFAGDDEQICLNHVLSSLSRPTKQ